MKKFLQVTFTLFTLITLLIACSNGNLEKNEQTVTNQGSTNNNLDTEFPVNITDGIGNKVTIEEEPERIVSLIPSNTEIAFTLGLGNKIVGVSDFDNYPEEVLTKDKIGGLELNLEKIISLQPDLVLAHASTAISLKDSFDQLKNTGIKVVFINDSSSFEDVYRSIKMIGQVTGTTEEADEIVASMKVQLEKVQEMASSIPDASRKSVFVEVGAEPEIYTTGANTFMNEMIEAIGATNIAADLEGWQPMGEEAIIEKNPDVIITTYGSYTPNASEQVLARQGWDQVNAIKDKQVFDVHPDLVTRSGPRLIDGVKELAKAVYPDVFKEF